MFNQRVRWTIHYHNQKKLHTERKNLTIIVVLLLIIDYIK